MVGLSRIWLSLGLVVSLTAALLVGLPSPAGAVAGYGDVGEGTWYTDAVQWSTDNGIADIAGFCFGPDDSVSRGETAVWIYNMENRPDAGDVHSFSDVTDASQDDAISWMANNEITTGTSPSTFAPDDTLTRAQAAAFLHRLAGEPSAPPHNFGDVVAGWQQDAVSWMAHTDITTGTSPTTFAPEDTLKRAQLITFLYRYQGEPEVTLNTTTPNCYPAQSDSESDSAAQTGGYSDVAGTGSFTAVSAGDVTDDDTEAPSAPEGPAVTAITSSSLALAWDPPHNAGPEITGYEVQYRASGDAAWTDWPHSGTARTATITDLVADTDYELQVLATNPEGTSEGSRRPILVTSVSAGDNHSCAVMADFSVDCWGNDDDGQLSPPSGLFTSVSAGGKYEVSANRAHSCGLKTDGAIECWGADDDGQVTDAPSGSFVSVSAGGRHSCALRAAGTAVCWGRDDSGQATAPAGSMFTSVSAGGGHSCGLTTGGDVRCWGWDGGGQVTGAPSGSFVSVSAGGGHSCAVRADGAAVCWGWNGVGQVSGAPSDSFTSVSAGEWNTCGLTTGGAVRCWGWIGGPAAGAPSGPFASVSAGAGFWCAVRIDGGAVCWGWDDDGQSSAPTVIVTAKTAASGAAPGPDLIVSTFTVDNSSSVTRTWFILSATVRNQGNAPSAFTRLRYFRSTDAAITSGDRSEGIKYGPGLDVQETGVKSVWVAEPSTPGTYYYGACVDTVADESETTNNCSTAVTVTVGAAPPPDLVVDTRTVDTSAPGGRFTLSATVRNQGDGPSASTTLRYYRSVDATITTGDTEVGTDSVSDFWLHSSGISPEEISLFAPSSLGVYYYGACVDSVSDESNSENNCSSAVTVKVVAVPAPDLIVSTFTVDNSSPFTRTWFILSATVRNQGNAPSASTWLRYYRSTDATITTGDTQVGGTYPVSRLDAQESEAESLSRAAPSTPGTYYYGACVGSVSDESDTTNNCSSAVIVTVGAAPAPDLVVDTPTVDTSAPVAGGRFTLSATVRNQGSGPSASAWLRFGRSTDPTTDSTQVGTTAPVSELGAQENDTASISLTAPSTPGTYYYKACVARVSDESDTTNNCSDAVTVTVGAAPAPDLVVDTPTASENAPAASTSFTLNVTVRNQGDAPSASTTLRYYASIDPYLYPELPATTFLQVPFHTDHVGDLAPSGSSTHSVSVRTWDDGTTRYYRVCVGSVTDEDKTANNCSEPVAVHVTGTPDLVVDAPTANDDTPIAAGTPFSLSTTVRNRGNGSVPAATLFYYLSTDSTISSSDQQVGSTQVSGVRPYGTSLVSVTLTAPVAPGVYYYGACVGLVEGETNATNNCSAPVTVTIVPAPGPDLVVDTSTIYPTLPGVGTSFTLYLTVRNQGADPSTSPALIFYRSTDSTITTSDERIGSGSRIKALSPAESAFLRYSTRAPSTSGTYYYGACVVSSRDESNTTNNCSPALTVVVGHPDLVVDTPLVDLGSVDAGRYLGLTAVVRNQGTGSSPSTTLQYYLSTDSTITSEDTPLRTERIYSVDSSDSARVPTLHEVPSTAGTYYYGICVDSVPGESNTTNNCSAVVKVTVEPADLTVLLPTLITLRHRPPDEFVLRVSVLNRGNLPSVSTTLRYYRSTDATITRSDTPIGTDSVGNLSPHRYSLQAIGLTEPSAAGTYYYGACVDAIENESTTNNCSEAVQVTVGAVQPPALTLRLTACFVFQNQHFVRFKVIAHISVSSLVVKTYQVARNHTKHLIESTNVGNLAAGNSYTKLTSRYFPANLRRNLTTCTADVVWDNGTATPNSDLATTEVPDLPPPDPTDPPVPPADRLPTQSQTYRLFRDLLVSQRSAPYSDCGGSGHPPCPAQDHIAWWSSLPANLQRCAFQRCDFD